MNRKLLTTVIVVLTLFGGAPSTLAQKEGEVVSLSDMIGPVIDKDERERYHLFPDIEGFQSARLLRKSPSKLRLEYTTKDARGIHHKARTITAEAFELTRLHVKLAEDFYQVQSKEPTESEVEAELLYKLALKYAAQARYDVSTRLLKDLLSDYTGTRQHEQAETAQANFDRLRKTKKALFKKGALLDQSGRTDLLIFSGYYGLWLGVATPAFLEAESSQAYALGLLLGGPLSVLLTHGLTKEANISEGRATMIALGGHWGTWQGLGWAAVANVEDGNKAIGTAELLGLAGIGAATLLTTKVDFSEGHAALTSSGLEWGAWFGAVFAAIADHEDEDFIRDMLIGSDALILGTGIATRNVRMSEARVRLINLAGVIGTVFGIGLDLLVEVDDVSTALAVAGLGSLSGLALGTHLTRNFDKGRDLAFLNGRKSGNALSLGRKKWTISPHVMLHQQVFNRNELVPALNLRLVL